MATHYGVLGVSQHATPEEIKAAYRAQARRFHPDKAGDEANVEHFKLVAEAYRTLSDLARRAEYDRSLRIPATVAELLTSGFGRCWLDRIFPSPPKAPKRGADQVLVCPLPKTLVRDGGFFTHPLLLKPILVPARVSSDQLWTVVVGAGAPGANGGDAGDLGIVFLSEEGKRE